MKSDIGSGFSMMGKVNSVLSCGGCSTCDLVDAGGESSSVASVEVLAAVWWLPVGMGSTMESGTRVGVMVEKVVFTTAFGH